MGDGFLSIAACVCPQTKTAAFEVAPLDKSTIPPPPGGVNGRKSNLLACILLVSTVCSLELIRLPKTWGSGVDKRKPCGMSQARLILHCWRNLLHRPLAHAVIPLAYRARTIRPMRTHPFRMVSLQSISTLTSAVANRLMFACAARERIYLHAFYYR